MNSYLILTKTHDQHKAFVVVAKTPKLAWNFIKMDYMKKLECDLVWENVDVNKMTITTQYKY